MRLRILVLGVVGMLATACVSKTDEAAPETTRPAETVETTTTSTSPRPTAVEPDVAIAAELASILATADVARFNARICPGTSDIKPVPAIGVDYASAQPGGVDTYTLPIEGESVAAKVSIRGGQAELVVILGLDYNTYEWCAYSTEWCPIEFGGLAPFLSGPSEYPALRELTRTILCQD